MKDIGDCIKNPGKTTNPDTEEIREQSTIAKVLRSQKNIENKPAKDAIGTVLPNKSQIKNSKTMSSNVSSSLPRLNSEDCLNNVKVNETSSRSSSPEDVEQHKRKASQLFPVNAFQFLMNSRHKVIGRNSPGKELEATEEVESPVQKENQSARKILLQNWATSKTTKRKNDELEKDQYISHVLEKRTKRMKNLLGINNHSSKKKKAVVLFSNSDSENSDDNENMSTVSKKFTEIKKKNVEKEIRIKKRGRPKIDKNKKENNSQLTELVDEKEKTCGKKSNTKRKDVSHSKSFSFVETGSKSENNQNKVSNLITKQKSVPNFFDILKNESCDQDICSNSEYLANKRQKKRKKELLKNLEKPFDRTLSESSSSKIRKKSKTSKIKTVKKHHDLENGNMMHLPIKHKKSKSWTMKLKGQVNNDNESSDICIVDDNCSEKLESYDLQSSSDLNSQKPLSSNKNAKLAPLFLNSSKQRVNKAAVEARKNFLNSGLPATLLKSIEQQKSFSEKPAYETFPTISHVRPTPTTEQINKYSLNFWDLPEINLKFTENTFELPSVDSLGNLETLSKSKNICKYNCSNLSFSKITRFKKLLKEIKSNEPSYPTYKAFKILRRRHTELSQQNLISNNPKNNVSQKKSKKKGRKKKPEPPVETEQREILLGYLPDSLTWVEKYKLSSSKEAFGNVTRVFELKKWLDTWVEFEKEINSQKRSKKRNDSSSSSDFEMTDSRSNDTKPLPGNALILIGPHGSGKTSSVYAACNELDINVIELNASNKRTGKHLLQEIQEATQSHQVRKIQAGSIDSFFQESNPSPSTSSSQNSNESCSSKPKMCLLLVEDVDIVFEQDEGFLSALSQILLTSKRPVMLTTADPSCLHLQKFIAQYPVLAFAPMSPKTVGGWLQMVCLVEGVLVQKESVCNLLEINNGDMRKTLLQLQYWVKSGGNVKKQGKSAAVRSDTIEKVDDELLIDESSSSSYFKYEEDDGDEDVEIHGDCSQYFTGIESPHLGDELWWNLYDVSNSVECDKVRQNKTRLHSMLQFLDCLSLLDCSQKSIGMNTNKETSLRFSKNNIKDSLSLNECLDEYEGHIDFVKDFSQVILKGSFGKCLEESNENIKINFAVPSLDLKKWKIKRHSSDEALRQVVALSSQIDKRSIAIDYLPTLRNIARSEASRLSTNSKRGNRFYHYLRGIGLEVNETCYKTACETLNRS